MALNPGRPRLNDAQRDENRKNAVKRYQQSERYRAYKKNYSKNRYLEEKKAECVQLVADHYNNLRGPNTIMSNSENARYEEKVANIICSQTVQEISGLMKSYQRRWQ